MTVEAQINNREAIEQRPPHPLTEFWWSFLENRGAVGGLAVIIIVFSVAILADVVAPYSPTEQYPRCASSSPAAWEEGGSTRFLLGTDDVGRDILSRLVHGARAIRSLSALVTVVAVA